MLPVTVWLPVVVISVVVKDPLIVVLPVTDRVPLAVIVAAANVPVNVGPAENTRLPVPVAPVGVTPSMTA